MKEVPETSFRQDQRQLKFLVEMIKWKLIFPCALPAECQCAEHFIITFILVQQYFTMRVSGVADSSKALYKCLRDKMFDR